MVYYNDEMLVEYIRRFMNVEKGSVTFDRIKDYVKENEFGI